MSGVMARRLNDPCLDRKALHARPAAEVWTLWLEAGRELLSRSTAPVDVWMARSRERRMLARMREPELKDLGLTPQSAKWEVNKPFWRE